MTEQEIISVSEFARRIGVNESAIRQRLKSGIFSPNATTEVKGKSKIVWPLAKTEWDTFGGKVATDTPTQPHKNDPNRVPPMAESKAVTEFYRSEIAKLDYEERNGTLVKKEDVYEALQEWGITVREALFQIPNLTVDNLMACTDRGAAMELLRTAIEDVLIRLTSEGVLDNKSL